MDKTATLAQPILPYAERIQRVVTRGGVEAWLVEDYTVPIVALEFSVAGGGSQDPADKPGVGHLLSGLLDEGAGPYDASAFHERLDEFAIELHFGADRDTLSGHLRTLAKHRGEAFAMLRLALLEARLDPEPVERVRAQVLAGLRHESTDPDVMANRAWFASAFAGHAYSRPTKGTLESLAAITRDDLLAYRDRVLARSSLRIAVVGAIDAATLKSELELAFDPLPATARLVYIPKARPGRIGTREVIDFDIPQSSIRFGATGLARNDPDWVAATVVNHILGGGVFSSRLFREVREKRGLAYSVYSQLAPFDHGPIYVGGTSTKNERALESLALIEAEIAALAKDGPTETELETACKFLIGSYPLRFDTSTKLAGHLAQIQVEGLGIDYMDRRNGLVAAITPEDAARAARRLFGEGQVFTTIVGRPVGA
jgi:zinc protease